MKPIEEIVKELPPDLQKEVYDFAQYLLKKKPKPKQRQMKLTWAGALKEYRNQYTSLELQKKALEWWGD
jgi:galactose-1-phosphate uridylyltransferase